MFLPHINFGKMDSSGNFVQQETRRLRFMIGGYELPPGARLGKIRRRIHLPEVAEVAERTGIDARNMMLGWGDWQLVCTVPNEKVLLLRETMVALDCPIMDVGWVSEGEGHVWVHDASGRLGRLTDFASTRFNNASYFTHGLSNYIHQLRNQPLFHKEGLD